MLQRPYRGGQEAGRATNQQSIHDVRPWNSQVSFGEYSKCLTEKARVYLGSAQKPHCGTIMERYVEDEQRIHQTKNTRNPTSKNLTE